MKRLNISFHGEGVRKKGKLLIVPLGGGFSVEIQNKSEEALKVQISLFGYVGQDLYLCPSESATKFFLDRGYPLTHTPPTCPSCVEKGLQISTIPYRQKAIGRVVGLDGGYIKKDHFLAGLVAMLGYRCREGSNELFYEYLDETATETMIIKLEEPEKVSN